MKKWIAVIAMAAVTCCALADGLFTVTQYNLKSQVLNISEAEYAIEHSSTWLSSPATGMYDTIAFSFNFHDYDDVAHFISKMRTFPQSIEGNGAFAVTISGTIDIPDTGNWTFACGSDDGFRVSVFGHGISETFVHSKHVIFTTLFKTINFKTRGKYALEVVYYNTGFETEVSANRAGIELSVARGAYSSFNSSAFQLLEAAEGGNVVVSFNANGGIGTMAPQTLDATESHQLPANQFTRDGYHFIGWAESKSDADNGIVKFQDGEEIDVDSDKTLYAVWERNTYQVRLHPNLQFGQDDPDDCVYQTFAFGESQALMGNPFKIDHGAFDIDVSKEFLGWSVGTSEFDWTANGVGSLLRDGNLMNLTEADLLNWASAGAADVEDGVPTLHLHAIWKAKVRADIVPETIKDYVQFKLGYDNEWRASGESVVVPPGKHALEIRITEGLGSYSSQWTVRKNGVSLGDGAGGTVCSFDIPSAYGPKEMPLEVSMVFTTGKGNVKFHCVDAMTDEQRAAWSDVFPAFDEGNVQITLTPISGDGAGLAVRLGEWEELPAGEYLLNAKYMETAGGRKLQYWELSEPRTITVENGGMQDEWLKFLPFGRETAYSFALLTFDGAGGEVPVAEMWFLAGRTTGLGGAGADVFSENKLPKARQTGGWRFSGWLHGGTRIATLESLDTYVRRWLNNDPPTRRFALSAEWVKVEAATGTGTEVPYSWLETSASGALAVSSGNYETAAAMLAANGCRTVGECYALGIDPEDPDDDFRIANFEMKEGKPVITLNHTEDGSGNSFAPRVRTLGAKELGAAAQWDDVTDVADPDAEGYRFFKATVELP